jgi:hypothetical protein
VETSKIKVGAAYQTKIGLRWRIVTIFCEDSTPGTDKAGRDVINYAVRTPAGNLILRNNRQLRSIDTPTGPKGLPFRRGSNG